MEQLKLKCLYDTIDLTVDHIIPIGDTKLYIVPHLQLNICDESVCLDSEQIIELRNYLNKFIEL